MNFSRLKPLSGVYLTLKPEYYTLFWTLPNCRLRQCIALQIQKSPNLPSFSLLIVILTERSREKKGVLVFMLWHCYGLRFNLVTLHIANALIQVPEHRKKVAKPTPRRVKCESKAAHPRRTAVFVITQGTFWSLHPGIDINHRSFKHSAGLNDSLGEVFDLQTCS